MFLGYASKPVDVKEGNNESAPTVGRTHLLRQRYPTKQVKQ
jgi:hypothetical protein